MGIGLNVGFLAYLGQYYSFDYLSDRESALLFTWMIVIDFYIIRVIYQASFLNEETVK